MTRASEFELSAAQAVDDLTIALVRAAADVLKVHGNDPNSGVIIAAGFCRAIEKIDQQIDPTFRTRVLMQLGEPTENPDSKPRI